MLFGITVLLLTHDLSAQRYASAVLAVIVCSSVRPSVRQTLCSGRINLALRKQHHTIARDSSFLTPKISAKFQSGHPQRGPQIKVGYISETVQDRFIVTMEG